MTSRRMKYISKGELLYINNPVTLRWTTQDPMAEKYMGYSPYNYCVNSPINFVDPNGLFIGDPPSWGPIGRTMVFALKNPIIALKIGYVTHGSGNISTVATRFATKEEVLYGSKDKEDDRGSENGAFRHVLWQASITSQYGEEIALKVGNAHEKNPNADLSQRSFDNISDADEVVDLLNNQIGRKIGSQNPNLNTKEMALSVLEEFKNSGLYTAFTNEQGKWIIKKTKLSNKKYSQLRECFLELNYYGRNSDEQKEADKKQKEIENKHKNLEITWGTMK